MPLGNITSIKRPGESSHVVTGHQRRSYQDPYIYGLTWIYVFGDTTKSIAKVGYTRAPRCRITTVYFGHPQAVECRRHAGVAAIKGKLHIERLWQFNHIRPGATRLIEQIAHAALREAGLYHVGEWYAAPPAQICDLVDASIRQTAVFWAQLDETDPPRHEPPCRKRGCRCQGRSAFHGITSPVN